MWPFPVLLNLPCGGRTQNGLTERTHLLCYWWQRRQTSLGVPGAGQGVGERFSLAVLLGINGIETGSSLIFSLHSPPFFFFFFLWEGGVQQHRIWGQHPIYLHSSILLSSSSLFWGAFSNFLHPGKCSSYFK